MRQRSGIVAVVFGLLLGVMLAGLLGCPPAATDDEMLNAINRQQLVIDDPSSTPTQVATAKERKVTLIDLQQKTIAAETGAKQKGDAAMGAASTVGSFIPIPGVGAILGALASSGIVGTVAAKLGGLSWRRKFFETVDSFDEAASDPKNPAAAKLAEAISESKPFLVAARSDTTIKAVRHRRSQQRRSLAPIATPPVAAVA